MAIQKVNTGYQIQWYDAEGIFRKRTYRGIDRREAERIEREILATRDRGERPPDERNAPMFSTFSKTWIEERKAGWKPSTLSQYQDILDTHLTPAFGELRVSQVTESKALQLVARLRERGLSARRINLILLVLKVVLKMARRRRFLREDPLAEVKLLKEPRTEVDPLDPQEVAAFLEACRAWWSPYFTVAFFTGARPNELAALKWGDVDWTRDTFRIRAGRYRGVEGTPKTESSVRDVDMLPPVLEALKAQRRQQAAQRLKLGQGAPEAGKDYIFTGPEGGLLNVNFLRDRVWYPTLTKAKLRRRIMYQTRHSFASNAMAAGESPAWVAAMLGHKGAEILFDVYARYIPNRTRRDGSAFASRMGTGPRQVTAEVAVARAQLPPETKP